MSDPMVETPSSEIPSSEISSPETPSSAETVAPSSNSSEPPPSYVKLAMRNMVRKGNKSLFHFALTATGLIGLFVGLAYLTR